MGIESPVCQIRDIGFDLTSNLFDRLKNKHNSGVITAITEKKKTRERLRRGNFKQFKSDDSKDNQKETDVASLNSEVI